MVHLLNFWLMQVIVTNRFFNMLVRLHYSYSYYSLLPVPICMLVLSVFFAVVLVENTWSYGWDDSNEILSFSLCSAYDGRIKAHWEPFERFTSFTNVLS